MASPATAPGLSDQQIAEFLELATKCEPSEAFQVAAETRAFVAGHGIDRSGEQETKTKVALEFFSRQLRTSAG